MSKSFQLKNLNAKCYVVHMNSNIKLFEVFTQKSADFENQLTSVYVSIDTWKQNPETSKELSVR